MFDAEILGILLVLFLVAPIYSGLRHYRKNSACNILIVYGGAGLLGSQIARMISHGFRQADLRAFASSGISPILGLFCGLAAGAFVGSANIHGEDTKTLPRHLYHWTIMIPSFARSVAAGETAPCGTRKSR